MSGLNVAHRDGEWFENPHHEPGCGHAGCGETTIVSNDTMNCTVQHWLAPAPVLIVFNPPNNWQCQNTGCMTWRRNRRLSRESETSGDNRQLGHLQQFQNGALSIGCCCETDESCAGNAECDHDIGMCRDVQNDDPQSTYSHCEDGMKVVAKWPQYA